MVPPLPGSRAGPGYRADLTRDGTGRRTIGRSGPAGEPVPNAASWLLGAAALRNAADWARGMAGEHSPFDLFANL